MQQNTLLDETKSHFDHWRTTRNKRGKIPEYLWDKVKPLMDHYSLTTITNALRINTNQIKENINFGLEINFVEAKWRPIGSPSKRIKMIFHSPLFYKFRLYSFSFSASVSLA